MINFSINKFMSDSAKCLSTYGAKEFMSFLIIGFLLRTAELNLRIQIIMRSQL